MLADLLKPLLSEIPAHLDSTKKFVTTITNATLEEGEFFGSLDVVNLYGSIPLTGQANAMDVVADFADENSHLLEVDFKRDDLRVLLELALTTGTVQIGDGFTVDSAFQDAC